MQHTGLLFFHFTLLTERSVTPPIFMENLFRR